MAFINTVVARAAASIWGLKLGNATMNAVLSQINANGGNFDAVLTSAFRDSYTGVSNNALATAYVQNLGLTGQAAVDGKNYVLAQLATVADPAQRGLKLNEITNIFLNEANFPASPYYSFAQNFATSVALATAYAGTPGTADAALGPVSSATSFSLVLGANNVTGTAGDDMITSYVVNGLNTLKDADAVNGGAGSDMLMADLVDTPFPITPIISGVETIAVRAQANAFGVDGDNNVSGQDAVQIDAQRISGATRFDSSNSREDLIIEDVRILPSQITRDITIGMIETDPGHVDYGVYFDQLSLRNQASATSSLELKIIDTGAAARGEAPLKDSNYGGFVFTATTNGFSQVIELSSQAIQDAQTYPELAAAFQAALNARFGAGVATATVGPAFTVIDPISNTPVTGNSIVIQTNTLTTFSTPPGSGYLAFGTAPPTSNFFTTFGTGQIQTASLVTSKIILDDVGRGSTGGDLVVGGLSTGATSSSLGVQRFEIEVRDNSKLESISSTNNTLREVTIVNGVTSSTSNAYVTTVTDAGNLTVNGNSGINGANITNGGVVDAQLGANTALPGVTDAANAYGFTDVRLIDGSAMRGRLEFSAQVTSASLAKYLNLRDIQALPAGDNIQFQYNGGGAADTMWVRIDPGVTASRNTIMSGREDFQLALNGGAGNDSINLRIDGRVSATGSAGALSAPSAWYGNQKLNRNVTVDGGDGDDTIRTPGAGDKIILGGSGNDAIYVDNSGIQSVVPQTSPAGAVLTAALAAELAAAVAARAAADATDAIQAASDAADVQAINALTPVTFDAGTAPTKAAIEAATATALANGAITAAQKIAIDTAYGVPAGAATITPPTTVGGQPTVSYAGGVNAGAISAAEFAAGNTALDAVISTTEAALAAAQAADTNLTARLLLLNATQTAVVTAQANATQAATEVSALQALTSALVVGATGTQAVAALNAAVDAGALTVLQANDILTAAGGGLPANTIDATELANLTLLLAPILNDAQNDSTAANQALVVAVTNNDTAVRAAALAASTYNAAAQLAAAAALAELNAAQTALDNANDDVADAQGDVAGLSALRSYLSVGRTDLEFVLATSDAVADGLIDGAQKAALDAAGGADPTNVGDTVTVAEKAAVDLLFVGYQLDAQRTLDLNQQLAADRLAVRDAAQIARNDALAAASATDNGGAAINSRAVWVLNTANQQAVSTTIGSGYVLAVNDERNVNNLASDANNMYRFFNTEVVVTFKGIQARASVPSTDYMTSDLQINQAIKNAINNDAVLSKLLAATDGPANTLVVTSLIDGVMSEANLSVQLGLPAQLSTVDVSGAATRYGVTNSVADVLAALTAALTSFDTKADYVDRLAESGPAGGNVLVTGAASTTTSDNTTTPGTGNDVITLGTTAGVSALLSSNDIVRYTAPGFGNDTIVHFKAGALATGGDQLDFTGLGGRTLSTSFNVDGSINVASEVTATNGTTTLVSGLFADSTTAQTHVYVAVDANNIGKVYVVTDAAGTGAGSVSAVLAGTIDLADTPWASLTVENFVG